MGTITYNADIHSFLVKNADKEIELGIDDRGWRRFSPSMLNDIYYLLHEARETHEGAAWYLADDLFGDLHAYMW